MSQLDFNKNSNPLSPPPYASLPIIQRFILVYKMWQEFLPHFPKKSKYTLGNKIDSLFVETLELIFIAVYLPRNEKLPYVRKSIGKIDLLKFFLQIAWEVNSLESNKYAALSEPLNEVGRMTGGWYRQLEKQTQP